jgi:hypothetical protein
VTGTPCARCRRRTLDGLLCPDCVAAFERAVGDLARLRADLQVVVAKLDEVSRAVVHRPPRVEINVPLSLPRKTSGRPLPGWLISPHGEVALANHGVPVNLDAVDLARKVDAALAGWVDELHPVVRAPFGPTCDLASPIGPTCRSGCGHPSCVAVRAGGWCWHGSCARIRDRKVPPAVVLLLSATGQLRRHPQARACVDDVVRLARAVETVVDRRDADVYCGPCDAPDVSVTVDGERLTVALDRVCGVDLYARFGDEVVECPACGYRYRIGERRPWLLEQCREVWERTSGWPARRWRSCTSATSGRGSSRSRRCICSGRS